MRSFKFVLLALFAITNLVSAQFHLKPGEVSAWKTFLDSASKISENVACSGQVNVTLMEADYALGDKGLGASFLSALENVHKVAGDIDATSSFRLELEQMRNFFDVALTSRVVARISAKQQSSSNWNAVGSGAAALVGGSLALLAMA
ncbi:hypothetical protein BJ742DRAFT_841303 [Cladochytrium replicatum]|nr:hypothetical protein BJ742DRAFT_841303 [Cladochytrium replicatum]